RQGNVRRAGLHEHVRRLGHGNGVHRHRVARASAAGNVDLFQRLGDPADRLLAAARQLYGRRSDDVDVRRSQLRVRGAAEDDAALRHARGDAVRDGGHPGGEVFDGEFDLACEAVAARGNNVHRVAAAGADQRLVVIALQGEVRLRRPGGQVIDVRI